MGNILKLVIQHESPVSSLFLETGKICPHKSAFLLGDNQLENYFRDGSGSRLILVLTYLLASFLTSAHPFPLEPPRLSTGNVLFWLWHFQWTDLLYWQDSFSDIRMDKAHASSKLNRKARLLGFFFLMDISIGVIFIKWYKMTLLFPKAKS